MDVGGCIPADVIRHRIELRLGAARPLYYRVATLAAQALRLSSGSKSQKCWLGIIDARTLQPHHVVSPRVSVPRNQTVALHHE
jgi:hypothetical protein